MKKYKLTKETKEVNGFKLFRIQALKDFNDVKEGDLGGWVSSEENLSQDGNCWLYNDSNAYGNSIILENSKIYNNVNIFGNANIRGNVNIFDNVNIFGNCSVSGDSWIYGNVILLGNSKLSKNSKIGGDGCLSGEGYLTKQAIVITGLRFNIIICDNLIQIGEESIYLENTEDFIQAMIGYNKNMEAEEYIKHINHKIGIKNG